MRSVDLAIVALYVVAALALGLVLAGRQRDANDYFLGHRGLPWWAIMLSIVATETSAVTVISVPGVAATGNLTFLQLPFGYLVGRIGVAALLLPGYFAGTQETAYTRLEHRFGPRARRTAAAIFLGTRSVADAVRVFATAIPLAIITRWSLPAGILAVGLVTLVYTLIGGLRAVVWVDVMQLGVYVLGAVATLIVALGLAGGSGALATALQAGKLQVFDFSVSLTRTYTFWGGLIGGALLASASHGTDHLIVQRLLASLSACPAVGPWGGSTPEVERAADAARARLCELAHAFHAAGRAGELGKRASAEPHSPARYLIELAERAWPWSRSRRGDAVPGGPELRQ